MRGFGAFILILALAAGPAAAAEWAIDLSSSSVTFETTAFGQPINGSFGDFGAEISLDPDDLPAARIDAFVNTASVGTGSREVDDALLGEGGFDTQTYHYATFTSQEVRQAGSCDVASALCLIASGTLSIRGVSRPLDLSFTLESDGTRAVADGSFVIHRDDFDIGTAEWELAGRETTVHLHIVANTGP